MVLMHPNKAAEPFYGYRRLLYHSKSFSKHLDESPTFSPGRNSNSSYNKKAILLVHLPSPKVFDASTEKEEEENNKAIAKIQALVRGFLCRATLLTAEDHARTHAVITLQACIRGWLGRLQGTIRRLQRQLERVQEKQLQHDPFEMVRQETLLQIEQEQNNAVDCNMQMVDDLYAEYQRLQVQNKKISQASRILKTLNRKLKGDMDGWNAVLAQTNQENETLQENHRKWKEMQDLCRVQIGRYKASIEERETRTLYEKRLRSIYRMGVEQMVVATGMECEQPSLWEEISKLAGFLA